MILVELSTNYRATPLTVACFASPLNFYSLCLIFLNHVSLSLCGEIPLGSYD